MNANSHTQDVARASIVIENSIREHAAAQGYQNIPEGRISAMVAHARGLMASMQPSQIAALASGGYAANQVASASFSAVFAPSEAAAARNPNMQYAALMAGTASDHPDKAKSFFDARGQTALDRAGSGGEGKRSSASYDEMGAHDWGSPAGMAQMRTYAVKQGVPWVASHSDLLKLGPDAIRTLAETHFREETYKRLKNDAYFKAQDVVNLAKFAKKHNMDANKLGGEVADTVKSVPRYQRHELSDHYKRFVAKDTPENRQALRDFEVKVENPSARAKVRNTNDMLLEHKGKTIKAEHKAENKEHVAATKDQHAATQVAANKSLAAGLN